MISSVFRCRSVLATENTPREVYKCEITGWKRSLVLFVHLQGGEDPFRRVVHRAEGEEISSHHRSEFKATAHFFSVPLNY